MQGIFRKENTDKALKYGIYRHLPTYEKIIRNLVSFFFKNTGSGRSAKPGVPTVFQCIERNQNIRYSEDMLFYRTPDCL